MALPSGAAPYCAPLTADQFKLYTAAAAVERAFYAKGLTKYAGGSPSKFVFGSPYFQAPSRSPEYARNAGFALPPALYAWAKPEQQAYYVRVAAGTGESEVMEVCDVKDRAGNTLWSAPPPPEARLRGLDEGSPPMPVFRSAEEAAESAAPSGRALFTQSAPLLAAAAGEHDATGSGPPRVPTVDVSKIFSARLLEAVPPPRRGFREVFAGFTAAHLARLAAELEGHRNEGTDVAGAEAGAGAASSYAFEVADLGAVGPAGAPGAAAAGAQKKPRLTCVLGDLLDEAHRCATRFAGSDEVRVAVGNPAREEQALGGGFFSGGNAMDIPHPDGSQGRKLIIFKGEEGVCFFTDLLQKYHAVRPVRVNAVTGAVAEILPPSAVSWLPAAAEELDMRGEHRILRHDVDPEPLALGKLIVTPSVRLWPSRQTREVTDDLPGLADAVGAVTGTAPSYFLKEPNYDGPIAEVTIYSLALPDMRRVKVLPDMEERFMDWRSRIAADTPAQEELDAIATAWAPVREVVVAKLRALFRGAQLAGTTHLFLTAAGAGAFENPSTLVPRVFREVLAEPEFAVAESPLREVVFAIDIGSFDSWTKELKPTRTYGKDDDKSNMWEVRVRKRTASTDGIVDLATGDDLDGGPAAKRSGRRSDASGLSAVDIEGDDNNIQDLLSGKTKLGRTAAGVISSELPIWIPGRRPRPIQALLSPMGNLSLAVYVQL